MSDKTDSYKSEDKLKNGREWHLRFTYDPEFPYPIPIVPMGKRDKHDPVGHLSPDGNVHIFNTESLSSLSVLACECVGNAGCPLAYTRGNNNRAFLENLRRASQTSSLQK